MLGVGVPSGGISTAAGALDAGAAEPGARVKPGARQNAAHHQRSTKSCRKRRIPMVGD
jgi:hypothetical protein